VTSLWAGLPGFDSRQGQIFLITTVSRLALGPTQPIQWVPRVLFPGVKRPGHEADRTPPSGAKGKTDGATPPFPDMSP